MKLRNIGYWFIIMVIAISGVVSWRIYFSVYSQTDSVNIHFFPKEIDDWVAEEIPVTDDEKAMLETDNVFVRRYTDSQDNEVYLFIVYSQNNRKVSHPPEICYTGGGATILDNVHDAFPSISGGEIVEVNRLTVEKGQTEQIFAYWFKVGDSFTSNYWVQQGLIALKTFLGYPSSSALIRVSSTVKNNDPEKAVELIHEFGSLIIPQLHKYLP